MLRRYSFHALILTAALALGAGSAAFAQAKKHTRRSHSAAARAAAAPSAGSDQASGSGFGVTETLSGTVQTVAADQNLLVISGPNGVPYDMTVTPKTLVVVNEKRGTIQSLASQVGKPVNVAFVPERNGDMATRIEVTD
jgi:hypothetical protein